ncbi:MAG: ABC transporter permease [Thermoleophilia bacterium]|nr:ABC transporter permease [Thermoleophilia bacterium]
MRTLAVSGSLAWRSILLVRRMPSVFIPSLVMPLFILVATAGAFRGIGGLPAFEGSSYLAFTIPMATVMGGGFSGINAGMTLARDMEGGFVDRLVASPSPRVALVLGPALAAMSRSAFTTTVIFIAGLIGGVALPGLAGTLIVYAVAAAFSVATACWAMGVALLTGTVQATPLMQVAVFVSIFFSVAYAPREAQDGWLRSISDVNPVTYLLEASRDAELTGVSLSSLGPAVLAAAGLIAALGAFAMLGLRRLGA